MARRETTIGDNVRTVDEGGLLGGQIKHRVGDLFRFLPPASG